MESSAWADARLPRTEQRSLRGTMLRAAEKVGSAPGAAVLAVTAMSALLCGVAADSRWLAALGDTVAGSRSLPDGLPYAAAPSEGWPNPLVAAELVFHGLDALGGNRGLMVGQVTAVLLAWSLLAAAMHRRGASERGAATALLLAGLAAVPALVAVRVQLFSLLAFGLLLLLLRLEHGRPSPRIWLLVPLLAVWANLHGAVLVGLAVAAAYLVVERLRWEPFVALGVLVASAAALLATPALGRTPAYFAGVLGNEAARRGEGLWAPLDLGSPLGLGFLVAISALAVLAFRSRPAAWEVVAVLGLGAMAIRTERSGIWLAMLLSVPAAAALSREDRQRDRFSRPIALGLAGLVAVALVRGPLEFGASERLVQRAITTAGGGAVLAEPLLAEQVAAAGGIVWVANPLDAFPRPVQREYLDWAAGAPGADAALAFAAAVLVTPDSAAGRRIAASSEFVRVAGDGRAVLYARRPPR